MQTVEEAVRVTTAAAAPTATIPRSPIPPADRLEPIEPPAPRSHRGLATLIHHRSDADADRSWDDATVRPRRDLPLPLL